MSTPNFTEFQTIDFPDPEAAREWADENADLTPAQRRRVDAWIKGWESELGQGQVDHLNNLSATIGKEYTSLVESLEADCREAAQIPEDLKRGRIAVKDALKRLAQLQRNRESHMKVLDAITGGIERWDEASDAEPVDRMRDMQRRFQVRQTAPGSDSAIVQWRYGVRSLTADVLRGETR
ncbi:hypothetical protein [Nocardioides mangrovi]|uniref:Uncharacterized protein n=1 Tax=Nocardioides mangrovi TaxID=2874580 RepID=A0ABS7UFJ5_9ACTN|nr:hypothetical protein [Nocardioides mangrovi]MBZ5739774.1 hypothetical protein [Nocardioides mangrovi]